jgi:hypothetical protein
LGWQIGDQTGSQDITPSFEAGDSEADHGNQVAK